MLTSPLRIFMTAPDPVELDLDYKTIQTLMDQMYRIG